MKPGSATSTFNQHAQPQGIPAHDLPFIFERFYRGEKSRSRDHGGAGIGLSLVKQIVEAHSGAVSVECRNGFTTFRVTLPRALE